VVRAYIRDAVIPCLSPSPIDLTAYGETTLNRFSNPDIQDTNQRVAADGCAKIPGFIAPTVLECLAAGTGVDSIAMLPALFILFMQRWAAGTLPFEYQDQALDPAVMKRILASGDPVAAFCADAQFWGQLAADPRLTAAVSAAYSRACGSLGMNS